VAKKSCLLAPSREGGKPKDQIFVGSSTLLSLTFIEMKNFETEPVRQGDETANNEGLSRPALSSMTDGKPVDIRIHLSRKAVATLIACAVILSRLLDSLEAELIHSAFR